MNRSSIGWPSQNTRGADSEWGKRCNSFTAWLTEMWSQVSHGPVILCRSHISFNQPQFRLSLLLDFAWASLASPVVDVGGGIGSLELALTKSGANGDVNFTIFDIPQTIENAKKV